MQKPIYLDNQATTPLDPRVLEAMLPFFKEKFGNPHSDGHLYGWEADEALTNAKSQVASLINADAREIIFTSGATESCNMALRGVANTKQTERNKIVTVATEHSCILETCESLRAQGWEVAILPVQVDGLIDIDAAQKAVDKNTLLVSVMMANNEIGVIQPIQKISNICKEVGALFHTDATQAVGKIPVDVNSLGVDFLSCSAHKFYGPKGIGALYVKWANFPKLNPIMTGGGQESGLRPGTVPVPLAVGFGEASQISKDELEEDMQHTDKLAKMLLENLRKNISNIHLFGSATERLPGNLNLGFPNFTGDEIVAKVSDYLAISTGSACSSIEAKESHVIAALDDKNADALSSVRISIGRFNKETEIDATIKILTNAVK